MSPPPPPPLPSLSPTLPLFIWCATLNLDFIFHRFSSVRANKSKRTRDRQRERWWEKAASLCRRFENNTQNSKSEHQHNLICIHVYLSLLSHLCFLYNVLHAFHTVFRSLFYTLSFRNCSTRTTHRAVILLSANVILIRISHQTDSFTPAKWMCFKGDDECVSTIWDFRVMFWATKSGRYAVRWRHSPFSFENIRLLTITVIINNATDDYFM